MQEIQAKLVQISTVKNVRKSHKQLLDQSFLLTSGSGTFHFSHCNPDHSSMPNSRYERSSFQGLAIIEGERSYPTSHPTTNLANDTRLCKQRNERRRRSSSLAQSHQIQDIIRKTVEEMSQKDDDPQDQTAEDRLKVVLIQAKESGFSADRIFSILGARPGSQLIPKQSFIDGLKTLGKCDDKELEEMVCAKFDLNKDGMISLSLLEHYCYYELQSVAWKAERQRKESSDASSAQSSVCDSRFDMKDIEYSAGPTVSKTSKLFWKRDISVNITLKFCRDLGVITMLIQNSESKEEYLPLYVNKKDCAINQDAFEKAFEEAIQTSDESTEEGKDLLRHNLQWEFYASYLVARLQMIGDGNNLYPSLHLLHGDEKRLEIEKPSNLAAPRRDFPKDVTSSGKSIEAEFKSNLRSFQRDSRSARTSRQSAQELTSIVESALNEILMEDGTK